MLSLPLPSLPPFFGPFFPPAQDPNATAAWNAVLKGRKKWILFPPHIIPPGVHPSDDGREKKEGRERGRKGMNRWRESGSEEKGAGGPQILAWFMGDA